MDDKDRAILLGVARGLEVMAVSLDRIGSRAAGGRDMTAELWDFMTSRGGQEVLEMRSSVFEVLERHITPEQLDEALADVSPWAGS